MAWVKVHNGALAHPKISVLFHWNDPLNVWFWGLLHAQMYQTNGYILGESVPKRGLRSAAILVARELWETVNGGWQIHDYLQWNDSREVIQERMQHSRDRLTKWRTKQRTVEVAAKGEETHHGNAFETLLKENRREENIREDKKKKTKSGAAPLAATATTEPDARRSDTGRGSGDYGTTLAKVGRLSKERPLFKGQRFAIFRWQLEELQCMLGPYAEQFDLHEWFFTLDTQVTREMIVISDSWAFVRDRTVEEAKSRGLAIAKRNGNPATAPSNKRIAGLIAGAEAFLRSGGDDHEES